MPVTTIFTKITKHEKGFNYVSEVSQIMGPMQISMNLSDIKINVEIDDEIFSVPAE